MELLVVVRTVVFAESRGGLAVTLMGTACLEAGARMAMFPSRNMAYLKGQGFDY